MLAYTYLQPSLTGPPRIPQAWLEPEPDEDMPGNVEPPRKRVANDAGLPPWLVRGTLDAAAEVSKLMYGAMTYNTTHHIEPGSAEDLKIRRGLYAEVLGLMASFPTRMQPKINFSPQSCLLR